MSKLEETKKFTHSMAGVARLGGCGLEEWWFHRAENLSCSKKGRALVKDREGQRKLADSPDAGGIGCVQQITIMPVGREGGGGKGATFG